jgi:hypothetical protein
MKEYNKGLGIPIVKDIIREVEQVQGYKPIPVIGELTGLYEQTEFPEWNPPEEE